MSVETLVKVLNNFPLGILLLDNNQNISYINSIGLKLLGIDKDLLKDSSCITKYFEVFPSFEKYKKANIFDFCLEVNNIYLWFYILRININYLCFMSLKKLKLLLTEIVSLETELNDILKYSFDGITVNDSNGLLTRISPSYAKITGINPKDFLNKPGIEMVKMGLINKSASYEALKHKKRVFQIQRFKNNNKTAMVTSTPVLNNDNEVVRVITNIRDITELYKIQEELASNNVLEEEINTEDSSTEEQLILYKCSKMNDVVKRLQQIAKVDVNVLITGESGVGKGLFAKKIYQLSNRYTGPLIKVNCAAIPENLLESELFGYEPGSFTGALKEGKSGLVENANNGVLFLDEIGELPYSLQAKLLEFLQEGRFTKIGATTPTIVNVRVIAATNQDLLKQVKEKKFREDLYYRLNVIPLKIPPLRERSEDITVLIDYYSKINNKKYKLNKQLSPEVKTKLLCYHWPGNVRELKHIIEALFITSFNNLITLEDLYQYIDEMEFTDNQIDKKETDLSGSTYKSIVESFEMTLINKTIEEHGSVKKAAEVLGVHPSSIWRRIKEK